MPRYIREDEDEDFDLESLLNDYVYGDFIQVAARHFDFEVKTPSNGNPAFICSAIELAKPLVHTNACVYTHIRVSAGCTPKDIWIRVKPQRFVNGVKRILKPGMYFSVLAMSDEDRMLALGALLGNLRELAKRRFSTVVGLFKALRSSGYWKPRK